MKYQEYSTLPEFETANISGASDSGKPRWANDQPPPAIGTEVIVTINNCGPAVVVGYFEHGGYLGLLTDLHNPPDWHVKQNKGCRRGHVFGPEFRLP